MICPTPMHKGPVSRFMWAKGRLEGSTVVPVYHGTNPSNLASIFHRGLLIPGKDNDLRVVNGSAFGLGIYTAPLSNPWLSHGYSGKKLLLLCACLQGGKGSRKDHLRHTGGSGAI